MRFGKLKGYKYIVQEDVRYILKNRYPGNIKAQIYISDYVYLCDDNIFIRKGYAWDGASGPTWDDKTNYDSSLVHDALYQLMREGELPRSYRKAADEELRDISMDHGMNPTRAKLWYAAVRLFSGKYAKPRKNPRGQIIDTEAL